MKAIALDLTRADTPLHYHLYDAARDSSPLGMQPLRKLEILKHAQFKGN